MDNSNENTQVRELLTLLDSRQYEKFIGNIKNNPAIARMPLDPALAEEVLLVKAINVGSYECAKVLIENGANVNVESDSIFGAGKSLLIMALGNEEFDIARCLLDHGADPFAGFLGPNSADYGIFLAKYSVKGLLSEQRYKELIENLRKGIYPQTKNSSSR